MRKLFFFIVSIITILSCNKSPEPETTDLLTVDLWKMDKITAEPVFEFSGVAYEELLTDNALKDCRKDNLFAFKYNGVHFNYDNLDRCNNQEELKISKWSIDQASNQITIQSQNKSLIFTILHLDVDCMILNYTGTIYNLLDVFPKNQNEYHFTLWYTHDYTTNFFEKYSLR